MKKKFITLTLITLNCTVAAKEFSSAIVTRKINDVKILETNKKAKLAKLKDVLSVNTMLQTGRRSRAELTFPDSSVSRLGSNTTFSFKNKGRSLRLENGSMLLQIPKNAGGATIYTNSVTAAVTGTTIMFEYNRNQWIKLISLEGKVSISTKKGGKISLNPGQMVYLRDDGKPLTAPVEVDLQRIKETSLLLSQTDFGKLSPEAEEKFSNAIVKQKKQLASGNLVRQKLVKREPLSRIATQIDRLPDNPHIEHEYNDDYMPYTDATGGTTVIPVDSSATTLPDDSISADLGD